MLEKTDLLSLSTLIERDCRALDKRELIGTTGVIHVPGPERRSRKAEMPTIRKQLQGQDRPVSR